MYDRDDAPCSAPNEHEVWGTRPLFLAVELWSTLLFFMTRVLVSFQGHTYVSFAPFRLSSRLRREGSGAISKATFILIHIEVGRVGKLHIQAPPPSSELQALTIWCSVESQQYGGSACSCTLDQRVCTW